MCVISNITVRKAMHIHKQWLVTVNIDYIQISKLNLVVCLVMTVITFVCF